MAAPGSSWLPLALLLAPGSYKLPLAAQTSREGQTTREGSDKYTDTKPSVIKKELAEGQLYQMQELTIRHKRSPDHKRRLRQVRRAQTRTQTPSQV